ncbi:S41 family peptidase [Flavobacterium rhizosphaerae]|uniref:S41 family peptidase n=1 Tax=Flavobacterium rhizosphaerae TaxID=3163298 RepID=A0ABW8Z0C1_9FLAO
MKTLIHYALIFWVVTAVSCQHDDGPEVYTEGSNEYVNQWAYTQMKRYYYWNGSMPGEGDLSADPKEYFAQLLHPEDRFSYTLHPNMPDTYPKSMRSVYGFDMAFIELQGQVYGIVLYALSGSPASNIGLHRGSYISSINGIALDHQNYELLYNDLVNNSMGELQVMEYTPETGFSGPVTVTISKGFTLLQPLTYRVIDIENHKTGYLLIHHFDVGLAQSFLQTFTTFKSHAINELVIDLRYNGGGDVSSATALSILTAPGIQADDLFITFEGNNNGGTLHQSFKQALEMNETEVSFQALRSAHPSLQRVYILCGKHTASASEIIINNLKPYMEVITIGEKTVGKDVAGFAIEDNRIEGQQGWELHPSIYKIYNANGQGNYSTGITPTIALNELPEPMLYPLGDPGEVLLQKALQGISGNGRIKMDTGINVLAMHTTDKDYGPVLINDITVLQ